MSDNQLTRTPAIEPFSARYQYYFRVLLCFSAAAPLIALTIKEQAIDWITAGLLIIILIYSSVAYWFSNRNDHPSLYYGLNTSDGLIIGLVTSCLFYNPLPAVLLFSMLQFNALSQGGLKHWLAAIAGVIAGGLIGYFALGKQTLDLNISLELSAATLLGSVAYICIYGICTFRHQQRLSDENALLREESRQHKLHAYKLSRYLPPTVWDSMSNTEKPLTTERKRLTVFFSDIVEFSQLSEELEAETLTELLNSYLTEMTKIANHFNGTIDKFMGDAIMIMFGDNEKNNQGTKKDCINCVAMAIAMRKRMKILQKKWAEMGIKKPMQIRMGINTGYCTVGTFGTSRNLDYTALGPHVNLASRLESAGQPGEILVSYETWALIKDVIMCRDKGQISVKGFSHPIQVYQVVAHRKDLGSNQSYFEENTEGFSMYLDMEKIRNYDKEKVVETLIDAAKRLKDKVIT